MLGSCELIKLFAIGFLKISKPLLKLTATLTVVVSKRTTILIKNIKNKGKK